MLVVNGQIRESLFGTVSSRCNLILHNRVLQVSQATATMCKGRNLIGIHIYVYVYVRTCIYCCVSPDARVFEYFYW